MSKQANKQLLRAVLEPRKPDALRQISQACKEGANPNGICPETSTSSGPVRGGRTLLTHAIHEWSYRVVGKLLECGADPNLKDENGWTPWMASSMVDESKRERIQQSLIQYKVRQEGGNIGQLARIIMEGSVERLEGLLEPAQDLSVLTNFRVDLVAHQIRLKNRSMLALLLKHNMKLDSGHLGGAVRNRFLAGVELILDAGISPESAQDDETLLMTAAALGELPIVKALVKAGANVNRYAQGNMEWTAEFYARQAGRLEVADWLASQMSTETRNKIKQLNDGRDPKYNLLYQNATASESLSTDELVSIFQKWDGEYGLEITDASGNSVTLEFSKIPQDIADFYLQVVNCCPEVDEYKSSLLKDLKKQKKITLWWD